MAFGIWRGGISDVLSPADLSVIEGHNFIFVEHPDVFVWKPESTGVFTVSSAFHLLRQRRSSYSASVFIWDNRLQVKISFFMWRLLNVLLPFADVLMTMGFSMPSKCPFCDHEDELQHYFHSCPIAKEVWVFFRTKLQVQDASRDLWSSLRGWWESRRKGSLASVQHLLPSIVCWELWKIRNTFIFEGITSTASKVILAVLSQLRDIHSVFPFQLDVAEDGQLVHSGIFTFLQPRARKKVQLVMWLFPPDPFLKVNIDGSALENPGPAACGMIIRDSFGMVVAAITHHLGLKTNMFAEISALLRAVQYCDNMNFVHVLFEIDSKILVQFIHGEAQWPWQYRRELYSITALMKNKVYHLQHVYREANVAADFLARMASRTQSSHFFTQSQLPKHLRGIISLDQQQIPYIRSR